MPIKWLTFFLLTRPLGRDRMEQRQKQTNPRQGKPDAIRQHQETIRALAKLSAGILDNPGFVPARDASGLFDHIRLRVCGTRAFYNANRSSLLADDYRDLDPRRDYDARFHPGPQYDRPRFSNVNPYSDDHGDIDGLADRRTNRYRNT